MLVTFIIQTLIGQAGNVYLSVVRIDGPVETILAGRVVQFFVYILLVLWCPSSLVSRIFTFGLWLRKDNWVIYCFKLLEQ